MKKSIRKATAGIMSVCLLSSMVSLPSASAALSGDVNEDGKVSVADIVSLQKYLIRKTDLSATAKTNADLTGDGKVNVLDLAVLKHTLSTPVSDTIQIHLSDSGITVEGDTKGVVSVSGKTATITASGNYVVDGTITEGQILVNVPDVTADSSAVSVQLNNVTMTNSTKPCILSQSADKLKLTCIGTNTLTDTATTAYTDTPGCIYSLSDLTITKNSTGTLNVTSSLNHGIFCNEDLNLNGGTVVVNTDVDDASDADAIRARETVSVDGATVSVTASGDGIKSTKRNVEVASGTVEIKSGNDAVQAATSIDISGGSIIASGDRGFRLDDGGALNITGGSVLATATDYPITNNTIDMSGSTQGVVLLDYAAEHKKSESIVLQKSGSTVYSMTPLKKYSYALVSGSSVTTSGTYQLYTNGTQDGHTGGTVTEFAMSGNGTEFKDIVEAGGGTVSTDDNVATEIVYSGSSVTVKNASGNTLTNASNLTVSGSVVTVNMPSVLSVSGTSTTAQVIVDVDKTTYADGTVELDLTGADLSNASAAPIYVKAIGDEAVIVAKKGTTNTISDGSSHTDTDSKGEVISAAIFAEDDLKIKGSGSLTVNGNTEDGIVCKNDLKLWNGSLTVNAVDDGIRGNDSVRIGDPSDTDYSNLNVTIHTNNGTTGGDGIKANSTDDGKGYVTINGGTVYIDSYSDGIQAEQAFTMNGGDVTIKTYETSTYTSSSSSSSSWGGGMGGGGMDEGNENKTDISAKGIKSIGLYDSTGTTYQSGGTLTINGGTLNIDSSDDCLHCAGEMDLYGGTLTLASADDGCHSDTTLNIGNSSADTFDDIKIYISYCYEGIEAADILQKSGTVVVNSRDDGYNAAAKDSSSDTSSWGGGMGGMGGMGGWSSSSGNYSMEISGGFALVNAQNGDHDGFDSNGSLTISGGYVISNGQETFDSDGTLSYSGGVFVAEGSTNLSSTVSASGSASAGTRITLADGSGNVIVSFIADKSVSQLNAGCNGYSSAVFYTGGTISGGTCITENCGSQLAYVSGTISGGTQLSSSSSGGNGGNGGNNRW
jgi:hypothetical protein